jgi:hypothetical protein
VLFLLYIYQITWRLSCMVFSYLGLLSIYFKGIKAPILNLASETSLGAVTFRASFQHYGYVLQKVSYANWHRCKAFLSF